MKILAIPSFYRNDTNPESGSFFRELFHAQMRSGEEVYVLNVYGKRLSTLRDSLLLMFPKYSEIDDLSLEIKVDFLKLFPSRSFFGVIQWTCCALVIFHKYSRKHGIPDIVHAHNSISAGIVALLLKILYGVNYIVTEHSSSIHHGLGRKWEKIATRLVYDNASKVVCVSQALCNKVKSDFSLCDASICVIPNLIDTGFFRYISRSSRDDVFIFSHASYFTKGKRIPDIIEALKILVKRGFAVKLLLCGTGEVGEQVDAAINENHLDGYVERRGRLSRDEIRSLLFESHAVIYPSTSETFGLFPLEAISTGIPAICTQCGGPEDFITDMCGVLIPVGSVCDLANAMQYVMNNYHMYKAYMLHNYVVSKFSPLSVVKRIDEVYKEVIDHDKHCYTNKERRKDNKKKY